MADSYMTIDEAWKELEIVLPLSTWYIHSLRLNWKNKWIVEIYKPFDDPFGNSTPEKLSVVEGPEADTPAEALHLAAEGLRKRYG